MGYWIPTSERINIWINSKRGKSNVADYAQPIGWARPDGRSWVRSPGAKGNL